jgi:serine/threonine-protein phosphatase 5
LPALLPAVSRDYSGPHLSGALTLEFVQSMLAEFKAQRQIHRKYAYRIIIEAVQLLQALPTVVDLEVPKDRHITVCGDVHGTNQCLPGYHRHHHHLFTAHQTITHAVLIVPI